MSDDIDDLIRELKEEDGQLRKINSSAPTLSANMINDYILNTAADLISSGMQTLEVLQRNIMASASDAESVESYSSLLKSVTSSLDTLCKINIQQMKHKSATKLKKMDIEAKEKLVEKKLLAAPKERPLLGGRNTTNNLIVATRDDFFRMLREAEGKEQPALDVQAEEDD